MASPAYKPILISNYQTGVERDLEPWLLPNDAFPDLVNCYVFRGRVIRKLGVRQIGRLGRFAYSAGTYQIGLHNAGPPQTFGPLNFAPTPIGRGTVYITDEQYTAPGAPPSVVYTDDGNGNLTALFSTTVPPVPIAITGIVQGNPTVIQVVAHPFSPGQQVWITGVQGMSQINQVVQGVGLNILATTAITITVNIDSTTFDAYQGGGFIIWYGGTVNYTTGAFTVTFYTAPNAQPVSASASTYPCLPVMGLSLLDTPAINKEQLIAFDLNKAYRFDELLLDFRDISFSTSVSGQAGPISWNSSNFEFFWPLNYANALFVSNFHQGDPIRFFATNPVAFGGYPVNQERWVDFQPFTSATVATDRVLTCLMMFSYRGRLVMLNTVESVDGSTNNYPQRARWSQNGTPYFDPAVQATPPAPFGVQADAWYSNINGKGGFIDAPTREHIVSAQFVDDNLIVFCERSTWMLRYTYDPTSPFVWERVNIDLGSESTFSVVPFDKGVFSVGSYGIISSDGNDTVRIDQKIPDEVFNFSNSNDGVKRVHGIRDFSKQLVYWTFPNDDETRIFPNRVLVLNYIEQSYSFFKDSFTCFGQFQLTTDITWAQLDEPWESYDYTWENPNGDNSTPQIVAGNQVGFVLQTQQKLVPDATLCLDAMSGTLPPTITSPNHNLEEGDFVSFVDMQGTGNLQQFMGNPNVIPAVPMPVFQIEQVIDANNFTIRNQAGTAFNAYTYTDSGEIIVQNNFSILTKRFNLALSEGRQTRIGYTDFYLLVDENGEFELDIYVDEDDSSPVTTLMSSAVEPSTSFNLSKVWKRNYNSVIGQLFQYHFKLSDDQMFDIRKVATNFELHAMLMWVGAAGRLPYG